MIGFHGKVVDDEILPAAVHRDAVDVGKVGGISGGTGARRDGSGLQFLHRLDEDGILLSQITRLEGMPPDHLFLLEPHVIDVLIILCLGRFPVFSFAAMFILANLQLCDFVFELRDQLSIMLLLLFQPLGVLLLALTRIKATGQSQYQNFVERARNDQKKVKGGPTQPAYSEGAVFVA